MNCHKCNSQLNNDNWLPSLKQKNKKLCKLCLSQDNKKRYSKNKEKYLLFYKNKRLKIKQDVFNYYGSKCNICNESDFNKLSLDHIEQNGRKHRALILKHDSGSNFYAWVNKNKPNNIRILCYNCNCQHNMSDLSKPQVILKKYIFDLFGGKCNYCNCNNYQFLTIDHINNDGAQHRKLIGTNIYTWIKKNNYSKENLQLLCYNCNYSKRLHSTIK